MNINISKHFRRSVIIALFAFVLMSCKDLVEDGYRIDYPQSDAQFAIEPLGYASGAAGDIVSYKITANSNHSIKSIILESNQPGANGSGYDVGAAGFDDPFADHIYGSMKKDISTFTVKYDYIIPKGINKSKLVFSLIDEEGKVSQEVDVAVVSTIKDYPNTELYSKDRLYYDAFATIDGVTYTNIKTNYSASTDQNIEIQKKIDIVFYYDTNSKTSVICAPNYGGINLNLSIQNATKFKKMSAITADDFQNISAASLFELTKADSISYYGAPNVSGIKVGDIIGFVTDINAVHSLKTGLIKINSLHPTNISRYEGTSYVLGCDIITQIEE